MAVRAPVRDIEPQIPHRLASARRKATEIAAPARGVPLGAKVVTTQLAANFGGLATRATAPIARDRTPGPRVAQNKARNRPQLTPRQGPLGDWPPPTAAGHAPHHPSPATAPTSPAWHGTRPGVDRNSPRSRGR